MDETYSRSYLMILEVLCGAGDIRETTDVIMNEIQALTGADALSIRVFDGKEDFPLLVHRGFGEDYVLSYGSLCIRDQRGRLVRDQDNRSLLNGIFGLLLRGRDAAMPRCFTPGGSFFSPSLSRLVKDGESGLSSEQLAGTGLEQGFESVMLVPLHASTRNVGVLHAASRREHRFTPDQVVFLEKLGRRIGKAFETMERHTVLSKFARKCENRWQGTETLLAMGEVSATLAHELKTPLSGMMLSATRLKKALKKRDDAAKLVAITEQLESAISTLSETVSHASGMFRKPVLELKDTDLNETIEEALTLFEPRAEGQGVRILREYAGNLPLIQADGNFLMRAFLNLIENALDVMPATGILRLETRMADDDHAEAVISDTGPGIDPRKAEKLFQPFLSEKKGGTGLGLAVVRKIVELHEGTVALRPAGERGAEAVVRFPIGEERSSESVVSMV